MHSLVRMILIMGVAGLATVGERASAAQPPVPPPPAETIHPSNFLVGFKSGIRAAGACAEIHTAMNAKTLHSCRHIPVDVVEVPTGRSVEEMIAAYRALPQVAYAEPNYRLKTSRIPNDPRFDDLWGLHNTGQGGGTPGADVGATSVWSRTVGGTNVIVAVIDTGIDYNHPDLADNMWVNPSPTFGDLHGATWTGGNGTMSRGDPMDDDGHGTHSAGTIGAVGDNGIGVAGVNWRARLMALKFLDASGEGWVADAISAIEYAIDNGARISNNSWGSYSHSQSLKDVIDAAAAANHLFIAAAGNDSGDNDLVPHYPSNYDSLNVIAVASSDRNDDRSWFSNWGATSVHLAAPGSAILSTVPGGGYAFYDGTSMAAPHVAGAAALLLSLNPGMDYGNVKSWILDGVTPLPQWSGIVTSGGRLNAAEALLLMDTTVARPAFEPDGGFYKGGAVETTVTCATAGATIRYTLDETEPDESSRVVKDGGTVSVGLPGTLKAKAWKDGLNPSAVRTASYVVDSIVFDDYNGDGKSDLAVYHEASGNWYILSLTDGSIAWAESWGGPGYTPVPGDFDGDGKTDITVYHEESGYWWMLLSGSDYALSYLQFGGPGYVPAI